MAQPIKMDKTKLFDLMKRFISLFSVDFNTQNNNDSPNSIERYYFL